MARILITGGLGFIGSHVAHLALSQGHQVSVLDNLSTGKRSNVPPEVQVYIADLRDAAGTAQVVAAYAPDWISHHAAQASVPGSFDDPLRDAEVNILGTLNLLQTARQHGVGRVVLASTGGGIYGEVPPGELGQAGGVLRPSTPYAVSKLASEQYLRVFTQHHGLPGSVLRYSNVYGERQSVQGESSVVAAFCAQLRRGEALTINACSREGDDGCVRDYVYVGDVARINLLALSGQSPPLLDVATGIGTSTRCLAETLLRVSGHPGQLKYAGPRQGDVRRSVLASEPLREMLGPLTTLQEGLRRTLSWALDSELEAVG